MVEEQVKMTLLRKGTRIMFNGNPLVLRADAEVEGKPVPVISQADEYKELLRNAKAFVAELTQGSRTPHGAALAICSFGPNYEKTARRIAAGEICEPEAAALVEFWQSTFLPALQRVAQQRPDTCRAEAYDPFG